MAPELLYDEDAVYKLLKVSTTDYGTRRVLYAGGPFIKISDGELASMKGTITSRYPDGTDSFMAVDMIKFVTSSKGHSFVGAGEALH